jgi:sugar (pentulose or hexulose) kinase
MIFVGVDVGTTRIKTVAYDDTEGRAVAQASVDTPVRRAEHGAVHEPLAILHAVMSCLRAVSAECAREITAISVVSLADEVVLVDAAGTPVLDAPVWYEPRGAGSVPEYVRLRGSAAAANPALSLFTLRWIAEQSPTARTNATRFTDMASFALCRLSGRGDRLVMDHSHASRTGAFALANRSFDADALEWAGDWTPLAPELVPSGQVIGTLTPELAGTLGLGTDVQIVSGAHDHFAAAFASGVRRAGDAMLSVGTAEAQLVLTDTVPDAAGLPVDVGCFVDDRTYYVHRGLAAGQLFANWRTLLHANGELRDAWFAPPPQRDRAAELPLCTIDPELATASFDRLPLDVDADGVLRCLSEGLAMCARDALELLERASGTPVRQLTVAGPAALYDGWQRLRAAILQRDMRIVTTPEPSALGAAVLAQRAVTGTADVPADLVDVPAATGHPYYTALIDAYAARDNETSARSATHRA